jgi:glycosyltransferase involved in cell wall biosynthesis
VAPSAYPLGGVAVWLDELVPGLRRRGWRVEVLLTGGRQHDAGVYREAHPRLEPVHVLHNPTGTQAGRLAQLSRHLHRLRAGVVVSMNIPEAVIAAARLRQRAGAARAPAAVMVLNGLEPDLYRDAALLEPLLDGALCSNRLCQAMLDDAGGPGPQRQWYTPYGVHAATTAPARDPATPLRIGFAGRFEQFQKRVQDLAAVDACLARAGIVRRWIIAGDGPDAALLQPLRDGDAEVAMLGNVARADMPTRFFSNCDVLLSPSEWETGPIVMWEAMAHGLAAVSSRYVGSGLEGSLRDGVNCLLFPTGDAPAAATCIARLQQAERRAALVRGGYALLRERYAVEACLDRYDAALRAIAEGPRRNAAPPAPAVAGRLDRWFGIAAGERIRRLAGRLAPAADPGDEWPHTLSRVARDDPAFWRAAARLDRCADSPAQARA